MLGANTDKVKAAIGKLRGGKKVDSAKAEQNYEVRCVFFLRFLVWGLLVALGPWEGGGMFEMGSNEQQLVFSSLNTPPTAKKNTTNTGAEEVRG